MARAWAGRNSSHLLEQKPPGSKHEVKRKLRVVVEKTGGPAELDAMAFLDDALRQHGEAAR